MQTKLSYFFVPLPDRCLCFNKIMISSRPGRGARLRVGRAWSRNSLGDAPETRPGGWGAEGVREGLCFERESSVAALPKADGGGEQARSLPVPGKKLPLEPRFRVRMEGAEVSSSLFCSLLCAFVLPKGEIRHEGLSPCPCGEVKPFPGHAEHQRRPGREVEVPGVPVPRVLSFPCKNRRDARAPFSPC